MAFLHSEESAKRKLMQLSPVPIDLAWHENRASFLSCYKKKGRIRLRLHRLFLNAPSPVLEAVVGYALKGDRKASVVVRQMAHLYFSKTHIAPARLSSKGNIYDLALIRDQICQRYFSPDLEVAIGWSSQAKLGTFKCMTFGSYDRQRNQIRIHPLLDDAAVPLYFLEFVVYHEMLHVVCIPKMNKRGAIYSHTSEFRMKEREFVGFESAKAWEKQSLQFFKKKVGNGRS